MKYIDIDLGNLLAAPKSVVINSIDPKLGKLPWEQLDWEDFQKLCARLIQRQYLGSGIQVFQYGKSGQKQDGIDIIWKATGEFRFSVAEVKHWQTVKPSNIQSWLNAFLHGERAKDSQVWILCMSAAIEPLVMAWDEAKTKLEAHGIQALVWDRGVIEELLRGCPELVEQFFSKEIRNRFCYTLSMPNEEPHLFRRTYIVQSGSHLTVENESVRMEIIVPSHNSPRASAILSFARSNLAGVSLAIDGRELVQWLQWAGHPHDPLKGPFTLPLTDSGRFLLTTPKFQLSLDSSEFEQLDWCLQHAWDYYLSAIQALENDWRCLRFRRLSASSQPVHALVSLPRSLWCLIMDYASEHDCSKGESDEHIFEASNSVLKVFSPTTKTTLDMGYHLISYAYNEGGQTGRYEPNVRICWNPNNLRDLFSHWGPRGQWDAEFAHDWLKSTLLPNVKAWYQRKTRKNLSWFTSPVEKLTGNVPDLAIEDYVLSLARLRVREISEAMTAEELNNCLHAMQLHFSCLNTAAELEPDLIRSVLRCVQHLAYRLPEHNHNYIRGNLQLDKSPLVDSLVKLIASNSRSTTCIMLEMALRSLICCCENISGIDNDLKWIKQMLDPVWARMREDLMCEMFSGGTM
ncbi:restriction endonuclease [Pseudomonas viridiflava]|uniref:restriction endonuclease n=1 Tax=Pseudomonas viridiflava TaxID=33069 RepID=UPI001F11AFB3|nr:restriction endonuclease [Pseudomonas viridiflava]